jgi:hypothetical protein
LGWFQGRWAYPPYTFYYHPHAYETTFDGHLAGILSATDLPVNGDTEEFKLGYVDTLCPVIEIYDVTTSSLFYQSNFCSTSSSIIVPTQRDDFSQGEIYSTVLMNPENTWMGGNNGDGTIVEGQYQSIADHNYYNWGSYSTCDVYPYWISSSNSNTWINGGSG